MISDEDRLAAANRLHDAALENNARLRDELAAARAERDELAAGIAKLIGQLPPGVRLEARLAKLAVLEGLRKRPTLADVVRERDEARRHLGRFIDRADAVAADAEGHVRDALASVEWEQGGPPADVVADLVGLIAPITVQRDAARAALDRVRALHREREIFEHDPVTSYRTGKQWPSICEACSDEDVIGLLDVGELIHEGEGVTYPCPTIAALDGGRS